MRYMMISFSVLVMILSQDLLASAKTDSVVTFLGGAHAKFVWKRWAWCNEDGSSKTQQKAKADGYALMLMDTRTGVERALLSGITGKLLPNSIRISRTGKWATYTIEKKTYIIDITVDSPTPRVLLDDSKAYWAVRALWIDPANGDEYAFCLDNARYEDETRTTRLDLNGNGICKVKLNADGTAGTVTKLTIINGSSKIDESMSVSADGKKLGGAFPWPDTKILDIATGALLSRHAGGFGCQANLAPDNSYRFYHCEGAHRFAQMWEANLSTQQWSVDLNKNLVGIPTNVSVDLFAPRWSNHVRYYTATIPMGADYEGAYCPEPDRVGEDDCPMSNGSLWNKSASWVQQNANIFGISKFVMGRFSSDFKSQEASILIASDRRYFQYGGDAWICGGTTSGDACASIAVSSVNTAGNVSKSRIQRSGSTVTINTGSVESSVIRISDARGRVVQTWSGMGTCALNAQDFAAGAYLVSIAAGARSTTLRLPLTAR